MEVLKQTLRYLEKRYNNVYFLRRFYRNSDGRFLYERNFLAKRHLSPGEDPIGENPEELGRGFSQIQCGAVIPIETYETFLKAYNLLKSNQNPELLESIIGILASLTFKGNTGIGVNLASDRITIVRSDLLTKIYENSLLINIDSDIKKTSAETVDLDELKIKV